MLKIKRLFGAATLAAMCVGSLVSVAPEAQALGGACKNVHFSFKNVHKDGRSIKVVKVKYYDKGDGKWRTEDVKDEECAINATCKTDGDDLSNMENDDMTKLRFIYRAKEADGDWSAEIEGGDKEPSDPRCTANRTYGTFDITG